MVNVRTQSAAPDPGPSLEVRRLKASESREFIVIGSRWWGYWTHWNEPARRSQPCTEPTEECKGHKKGLPLRWKAYLHVWDRENRDQCFLEFTPGLAREMQLILTDHEAIRGMRLKISRGKGNKARLSVEVKTLPTVENLSKLPAERDPLPTLLALWGYDQEKPPEFHSAS